MDIDTFVPLPRKYDPEVTAPASALIEFCCEFAPVPPLRIWTIPDVI